MTEERLPLAELLAKAGDGDFLRSVAEAVVQLLMETDVEGVIGAGRHERTGRADHVPQWVSRSELGHAPGVLAAADPEAAPGRQLLSPFPRAQEDIGEGLGRGDPGGVGQRRLDPARQ